jgi:hypothetical protein
MSERETNSPKEDTSMAKSQAALAAKAIKSEIKALAPSAIVKATSSVYSMGSSVDAVVIGDIAPEIKEQIEKLKWKYQYGSFNSMEDMYEISNDRSDVPQAKYVFIGFRAAA